MKNPTMTYERIAADQIKFCGHDIPLQNMKRAFCVARPAAEAVRVYADAPSGGPNDWIYWVNTAYEMMTISWKPAGIETPQQIDWHAKRNKLFEILPKHFITPILESKTFVFRFDGLTRSMTHQLVRHRNMAFSQVSMRVSNVMGESHRLPDDLPPEVRKLWIDAIVACRDCYDLGVRCGVPIEVMRDVLPNGIETSIYAVMRLREVIQYLRDRSGDDVQPEHCLVVSAFWECFKSTYPEFAVLVAAIVGEALIKKIEEDCS